MRSKPKEVFVVAAKRTASFWGTRLVSGFPQKDAVPFEKRSWARLSQKDVVILGSLVLVGRTTSFEARGSRGGCWGRSRRRVVIEGSLFRKEVLA